MVLMELHGNIRQHYLLLDGQASGVPSLLSNANKTKYVLYFSFGRH
jgi:hypothetical protein